MVTKQNFVFVVIWVINFLLALKLFFGQASVVLLAVLVFTAFLLTLTLKTVEKAGWHWLAVSIVILINNFFLFLKLFSDAEPQAGILIMIAIMAALLLLTLGVNNLEF
ncbi:hypothetical protein [Microcystis aeruginosa]|uniref:hypothetical protein n=1 Tax=Microcystis aeruginosa TaxID=1126 RepID=UPI00232D754F|nr:hypothetical protein [Microcystis aeruginosa]MDB9413590.1 hypothetical protein [Microcystis aeruginosa CS-567/02]